MRTTFTHLKDTPVHPLPGWVLRGIGIIIIGGISLTISLNRQWLQDFATLGYFGAFLVMLLSNATVILPAPGLIVVFALGASLNPVLVGVIAACGATLGEITGYVAGANGISFVGSSPVAQRIRRWMDRRGTLTIFGLSVVPSPFFDIAGLMAGAGKMGLGRFLSITFAGKTIQSLIIATAGASSVGWVELWLSH